MLDRELESKASSCNFDQNSAVNLFTRLCTVDVSAYENLSVY